MPRPSKQELSAVLSARGGQYGDFADNAVLTQTILRLLRGELRHALPAAEETAHMFSAKLSRIGSGGITGDSIVDIFGYIAKLGDVCGKPPTRVERWIADRSNAPLDLLTLLDSLPRWHDVDAADRGLIVRTFVQLNSVLKASTRRDVLMRLQKRGLI